MKRIALVLLAVLLVLSLAGCGGDKKSGAAGKASLVYWTMWNEAEPQGQVIAQAAEAFTKETGIKIDVNFNGRDIRQTLQPALEAGTTIDLFDEDVDRVNSAWASFLANLDPYVSKAYPTTGGKPFDQVVSTTLMNLVKEKGGGSVKSIPYQPFIFAVMYNKDLFSEAGITGVPKTWDELLDACAKLKAKNTYAFTVDDAYIAPLFGYTIARIAGKDTAAKMVANNDFSGPQTLRAAQLWENMISKGYVHPNTAGNVYPAGQVNEFSQGRAAMYLNGTWLPNEIKSNAPNMNWGTFAYPNIDPAGDGIEANNFGAQCFGVNKNSKYPEEAFQFIVTMTTGQYDEALARESLGVPMGNNATWPRQLADAKAVLDNTKVRLDWAANFQDDANINAKVTENFARMVAGSMNAQQFADSMKR